MLAINMRVWFLFIISLSCFMYVQSFQGFGNGILAKSRTTTHHSRASTFILKSRPSTEDNEQSLIVEKQNTDMLRSILTEVSSSLQKEDTSAAYNTISRNLQWLFSHNIPNIAELLLAADPAVRESSTMLAAFTFATEMMETIATETAAMVKSHQDLLRGLFQAARVSESQLDGYLAEHRANLTSSPFLLFLDAQIDKKKNFSEDEVGTLTTVKLRILDEAGREMGVDVQALARLAAMSSPMEIQAYTRRHIADYDPMSRELLVQTVSMMVEEMERRFGRQVVDPQLIDNMKAIKAVIEESLM